jgi:hypothetical protein
VQTKVWIEVQVSSRFNKHFVALPSICNA